MVPSFLYCVCQVGAEAALRREIAEIDPTLRSAFARPGLVTFKLEVGADVDRTTAAILGRSVLARACGGSLGPASSETSALDLLAKAVPAGERLRLQIWERDRWRPGEEPAGFVYGVEAAVVRRSLVERWSGHPGLAAVELAAGELAVAGERVADVIVVGPEEPWLVGLRRQGEGQLPYPGGRIPIEECPEAPSRAYDKLCEALIYADVPLRAGDVAVELGSAPGGASYALLRRGLEVHGVDPGAMDPRVVEYVGAGGNRFTHHASKMGQVSRGDLPRALHWIVADVNLAPQIALQTVRRLGARPRPALLGVLLTLKIDNWKAMRHLPGWLRQIEAMGMAEVRATQLSRNRMEVFASGFTPAGLARRAGSSPPSQRRRRTRRSSPVRG